MKKIGFPLVTNLTTGKAVLKLFSLYILCSQYPLPFQFYFTCCLSKHINRTHPQDITTSIFPLYITYLPGKIKVKYFCICLFLHIHYKIAVRNTECWSCNCYDACEKKKSMWLENPLWNPEDLSVVPRLPT